jgi:hypothetical protein
MAGCISHAFVEPQRPFDATRSHARAASTPLGTPRWRPVTPHPAAPKAAYLACADCVRQAEYAAHAAYGISAVEAAATIAAETWVIFSITTIQAVALSTALRHRQKKTKAFSCTLWRESRDFLQRLIDAQAAPCA